MTKLDTPVVPGPEVYTEASDVTVENGAVLLRGPGAASFVMTPDAARLTAERLAEAAEQAGRPDAGAPPFPRSELVSPHGA